MKLSTSWSSGAPSAIAASGVSLNSSWSIRRYGFCVFPLIAQLTAVTSATIGAVSPTSNGGRAAIRMRAGSWAGARSAIVTRRRSRVEPSGCSSATGSPE